jgi:hypothetical protein
MSGFAPHLRNLANRLSIPEPVRSRVLLEIATDMEDLFRHLVEGGMEEEEAAGSVVEQFDLSEDALRDLAEIHNSPISRSLEGISGQARTRWERVILGLVALFVTPILLGPVLFQPTLLEDASRLAFVLLGILVLGLGLGVWKAVALFRPGSRVPIPRKGLRVLPGIALLLFALGFAGIWVELYRAALAIRSSPGMALRFLVEWLHMASATMVLALAGALLTALLWFFLENRCRYLEERAAAAILATHP